MQTYSIIKECWKCKYFFLAGIILSVVLAVRLTKSQPDVYAARMDLVDEHKESIDFAVGLNTLSVAFRDLKPVNDGFENDPEMYASLLQSTDFMEKLQDTYLEKYHLSYKEYIKTHKKEPWWSSLSPEDSDYVQETIRQSLSCQVKRTYFTIVIKFIDGDRDVAEKMCQSVSEILADEVQKIYNQKRSAITQDIDNARKKAATEYVTALRKYQDYCDKNVDAESVAVKSTIEALKQDKDEKQSQLNKLNTIYIRSLALQDKETRPFTVLKSVFVSKNKYQPTPLVNFLACFTIINVLILMIVCLRKRLKMKYRIDFGRLASPWSITILVWAFIMILMQFRDPEFLKPLTGQIYYGLAIWIPVFCFFAITFYNIMPSTSCSQETTANTEPSKPTYEYSKLAFTILFVFSITCTPILAYKVYSVVSMFDSTDMLNNVRLLAVEGNQSFGFLSYTHVVNEVLLVVALWHYPKIPLWQVLLLVGVNIMSAIAIMEKGTLFFLAVSVFFVLFEKGIVKVRGIIIAAVSVFLIMFLFNIMRASEAQAEQDDTTAIDFFLSMYVLSPCQAFETITVDLTPQTGVHTFDTVYLFMQRFGVPGIEVPPKIQDFVWVPIITNVYTVMQPFYLDFGYKGIAFFAMVYGVMMGMVYRSYRNGSNVARCVYTFFIYTLVLQFYQEYIFLGIVPFIQFVFFTALVCQNKIILRWEGPIKLHPSCKYQ